MPRPNILHLTVLAVLFATVTTAGCAHPGKADTAGSQKPSPDRTEGTAQSAHKPSVPPSELEELRHFVRNGNPAALRRRLEARDDADQTAQIAAKLWPTVEELWSDSQPPTRSDEAALQAVDPDPVRAKDAASELLPYARGETESQLEDLLLEWSATDRDLRSGLGKVSMHQVLERLDDAGRQPALEWLAETDEPGEVGQWIVSTWGGSAKKPVAVVLDERARHSHPDLSGRLQYALGKLRHATLIPYFKKAAHDPQSSPMLVDRSMNAIKKLQGEKSAAFFSRLIEENAGKLRWAAVNDLIDVRGAPGIVQAAVALPLDREMYNDDEDENFRKDAKWFATYVVQEQIDDELDDSAPSVNRLLKSDRWPARVLGLVTARKMASKDLLGDRRESILEAVQKLRSADTSIPNWGEPTTVGQLADEGAGAIEESAKDDGLPPKARLKSEFQPDDERSSGTDDKPAISSERTNDEPALEPDIIRRVVHQHRREIKYCYEQQLKDNPDLSGQVMVRFTIQPSGDVSKAEVAETSLESKNVEDCLVEKVEEWIFPEPRGGGVVNVNYPFDFSTKD